ncbi:MAG: TolC family protein [Deltaproteobacteria bacterium]|nr:TolC family protein [Deltaproteobacteria bacterium]
MKQKKRGNIRFLPAIFISCILLFNGCTYVDKFKEINSTPAIMVIPAEKVQQIDMIELKKAPDEAIVKPETVEPEKAEYTLSLEECRALTLENNLDLKAELINPTIEKENLKQAEASKFEATFTGNTSYNRDNTPTDSLLVGSSSERVNINLGVDIPISTGGTVSFDLADTLNKTNSTWATLNPSYNSGLSASISQPLLKNAGRRAFTHSIRLAQYNSSMTDLSTKLAAMRIIANADRAYWSLYSARKMLDVRKQQYDLAKATLEETERFVEVGVKPRIEIIRTKRDLADKLTAIIDAENNVRERERDLKRMLNKKGLGMETKTVLIPSSLPDPVRYELDRNRMVENALLNRMDLLELELQLEMDSMTIEYNRNQTLPDLSFEYRYNIDGLGADRGDSYDMLADNDYHDHQVGIRMNIPIGNKRAKSELRKSIYQRAKHLSSKESKEAEIRNDVLNNIDKVEAKWQSILASRQSTILSDEQYRAEKRQYELGLVSSREVMDAQTNLAAAQSAEITSLTDYQTALIDLAYATGTLLGAAKVEWAPVVPVE